MKKSAFPARSSVWTLFLISALCVLGTVAWFLLANWKERPVFAYALDDPYIHMTIARNLAFHGVWGINSTEFASASSSPLWTLVLAFTFWILGESAFNAQGISLFWSAMGALALCFLLAREALCYFSWFPALIFSVVALFFVAVPLLVLTGMEHTWHCALFFLPISLCARILATARAPISDSASSATEKRDYFVLLAVLAASCGVRYETLFLVCALGLAFFWQRRWLAGFLVVVVSVLPLGIFALISLQQGWPPLPTSIWLKIQGNITFLEKQTYQFFIAPEVFFTWLFLFLGCWIYKRRDAEIYWRCVLLCAVFTLHILFSRLGWLFRYEAYLLAGSVLFFAPFLAFCAEYLRRPHVNVLRRAILLSGFCLFLAMISGRAHATLYATPQSVAFVRDQQLEMTRFFNTHFPRQPVGVNDIGAVGFLGQAYVLDLYGLANVEVARARKTRQLNAQNLAAFANSKNVRLLAIYPNWFPGAITGNARKFPASWIRCAQWEIANEYWSANTTVIFCATTPADAAKLRAAMRKFAPSLPPSQSCMIIENDGSRQTLSGPRRAN